MNHPGQFSARTTSCLLSIFNTQQHPHRLACFDPAVIFLEALEAADRQGAKAAGLAVSEELPQGVRQVFLVVLDGQQVITAPVENLPGNLGLTTDGVDRDDAGGGL